MIHVRIHCGGMHWRLQSHDHLEIWRGTQHLGTLSGDGLGILIAHQLATAEVVGWLTAALAAPLPPARRKPPQVTPPRVAFTSDERAAQKARRRTRRRA